MPSMPIAFGGCERDPHPRLMLASVAQLLPVVQDIALYDKEINRLFLSHEDLELCNTITCKGVAVVYATSVKWC